MLTTSTDIIEKKVVLKAPHERVWRAISEAKQFGSWFGFKFTGDFVAGKPVNAQLTPSTMDPDDDWQDKYAGVTFELHVDRIEPMSVFSFRWHPYAMDLAVDYSSEPMTLVVFALEAVPDGTLLTVTESGFDQIPLARRAAAFAANDGGWTYQIELIEKYVTLPAA